MYSASVLDNATMYCFLELQVTAPMPMWNEYLEIKCLCGCPAQSASQYPSRIMFSTSAKGQPEVLHVSKVCDYSLHTFPVGWSWILNELRQDPNCKCCIQVQDYYRPQETSNHLCIWHVLHSKFLHWGQWALIFTECDSWVHQHTDLFCIGKSKIFNHPFNITTLVDRYGPSKSISLDFKS